MESIMGRTQLSIAEREAVPAIVAQYLGEFDDSGKGVFVAWTNWEEEEEEKELYPLLLNLFVFAGDELEHLQKTCRYSSTDAGFEILHDGNYLYSIVTACKGCHRRVIVSEVELCEQGIGDIYCEKCYRTLPKTEE